MSCDTDEGRVVKISNVVGQSDPPPLRDGKKYTFLSRGLIIRELRHGKYHQQVRHGYQKWVKCG